MNDTILARTSMITPLEALEKIKNVNDDELCIGKTKKLTQFSIEVIVGEKKQSTLDDATMASKKLRLDSYPKKQIQNGITFAATTSNLKLKRMDSNKNKEIGINQNETQSTILTEPVLPKDIILIKKIPKKVLNVDKNDFMFRDKSSEVKHALTPVTEEKIPNHSCSPQLPAPSPNYPVQSCTTPMPEIPITPLSQLSNKNSKIVKNKNMSSKTISQIIVSNKKTVTFKPSLCYDKMQESAFTILNIPNVSIGTKPIAAKRQKVSKIDLATRKRNNQKKEKKKKNSRYKNNRVSTEYGVTVYGYSDWSDSDISLTSSESDTADEEEVDLVIKSGPPLELDLSPVKMCFLKNVELTTHRMKNWLELKKLERRKWLDPSLIQETSNENTVSLNLPVPLKSTLTLSMLQNYKAKKAFFHLLELKILSTENKQELEKNWLEVVKDRLKRNCESSVTKFTEKIQKKTSTKPETILIDNKVNEHLKFPITHQYKVHNVHIDKIEDCKHFINQGKGINCHPLSTISVENQIKNEKSDKLKETISLGKEYTTKFRWPGVADIIEAYKRYSKERSEQLCQLRKRQSSLIDDNLSRQKEMRFMERKQQELCSILFRRENEKRELQISIDQLKNCINSFR